MKNQDNTDSAKQNLSQGELISRGKYEKIDPERRKQIAGNATLSRWAKQGKYHGVIQQTTHEGNLWLLDHDIPCAVLKNEKRVLTQSGLHRTIGKSVSPSGRKKQGYAHLPPFLRSDALTPLLTSEIMLRATPIVFKTLQGNLALGYDADFLIDICALFLEARKMGLLKTNQMHIAAQCEVLTCAFARIGLISLIDEATNFQKDRKRDALSELLKVYLTEEMQKWAQVFPYEYYEQIFRLKRKSMNTHRNLGWIGHITNNLIYSRLDPGVLEELRELNPKDEEGRRKGCHHQFFNKEKGSEKLKTHVNQMIVSMRGFDAWEDFIKFCDRAMPKFRDEPLFNIDSVQN